MSSQNLDDLTPSYIRDRALSKDEELDALVKRLENVSLQVGVPSRTVLDSDVIRSAAAAITTLRAQLAEVIARAEQAEAERAAQIEADAWQPIETAPTDYTHVIGIDAKGCIARTWFFAPSSLTREWLRIGLPGKAIWHPTHWKPLHEPDTQPHSRTALDAAIRAAKVEAWKEAADLPKRIEKLGGQNYAYVRAEEIRALIEREGV